MVDPLTTTVQLIWNTLPAKVLLDILMVKGTRRKQTLLLSSLWGEFQATQIPADRITSWRNPSHPNGENPVQSHSKLFTTLSHLKLNWRVVSESKSVPAYGTTRWLEISSISRSSSLGNLASNGLYFARAASEIRPVLLLHTRPVSFPKWKQHCCHSPFPSSDS